MGIFTQPNSCFFNFDTARPLLVAAMVGLALLGIALLAQAGVLWQRMTRVHVVWWQRLPLVLLLVWAGGCLFYAVQAFISARSRSVSLPPHLLLPGGHGVLLYCYPELLDGQAQIALIGAICLLLAGSQCPSWLDEYTRRSSICLGHSALLVLLCRAMSMSLGWFLSSAACATLVAGACEQISGTRCICQSR